MSVSIPLGSVRVELYHTRGFADWSAECRPTILYPAGDRSAPVVERWVLLFGFGRLVVKRRVSAVCVTPAEADRVASAEMVRG